MSIRNILILKHRLIVYLDTTYLHLDNYKTTKESNNFNSKKKMHFQCLLPQNKYYQNLNWPKLCGTNIYDPYSLFMYCEKYIKNGYFLWIDNIKFNVPTKAILLLQVLKYYISPTCCHYMDIVLVFLYFPLCKQCIYIFIFVSAIA